MKFLVRSLVIPALIHSALAAGVSSSPSTASAAPATEPRAAASPKTEPRRHPLRGVITAVHADRSAIMVKHEEIPGVMRAMTMLFKVDAATLKSVEKGHAITGVMSRQGDEWWLHDVKRAEDQKK